MERDLNGFELNTDAAFVDPDWDVFPEVHDRKFGLAIKHFKSSVRGRSFDNEVMNLRVGRGGFYAQSKHFPAAFYGDAMRPVVESVDREEAHVVVWDAVAHYRSGEAQSLTCIYTDDDPPDLFFGYRLPATVHRRKPRYELGGLRSTLPLHMRVVVDAETDSALVGGRRGVLIYQRTEDRHLLVRATGRRQPFGGFRGLGD